MKLSLKFCCKIGVQLLLVPDLHLYPELFRRLVELETISAAIDRVELLLSVIDAKRVVQDNMLEDGVELLVHEVDGGAVPRFNVM